MSAPSTASLREQLLSDARPDADYLALLSVAAFVASLGLEQNSAATIIGAMVVAPLMLPIRALGFGLLHWDRAVLVRAASTIALSIVIVLVIGAGVGWVSQRPAFGSEILSRTSVTFLGLGVALASGFLAGISRALGDSKVTDSLIGVGISVSLVPPICTAGITLAYGARFESAGAFTIFLTNLIGISLACAIVFAVTGRAPAHRWRAAAGFAVFAAAIVAIAPVLFDAGYRARQESMASAFVSAHAPDYTPSIASIESAAITWKTTPYELVLVVRGQRPPTAREASQLNGALDQYLNGRYHLTIIAESAVTVFP